MLVNYLIYNVDIRSENSWSNIILSNQGVICTKWITAGLLRMVKCRPLALIDDKIINIK